MSYINKRLFIVLSLVLALPAYGAELTNDTVKQVISRIDRAVNDLNANALAKELSSNVSITINISMQGKKQVMKPSKQEYISMLQQGWAQYSNYQYTRTGLKIDIKGNKAFVSAVVKESMTVQGQKMSGTSKETATIELVHDKPLVTKIVGYTSM